MKTVEQMIKELFEVAGAGDLEGVFSFWHDDGVLEDMTLNRRFVGKAAVEAYLREYFLALPDLEYRPKEIWADGDRGVVMWTGTAHLKRPFFGFPADGRRLNLEGVDLFWIESETVVRERSWYGDGWLFQRLTEDDELTRRLMQESDEGWENQVSLL